MQQIKFNEYEKIASDDFNNAQLAVYQSLHDQFLYKFLGAQSGVIGGSFILTYTSALLGSLAAGIGYFYNSAASGFTPKYQEIYSSGTIAVPFTTSDPTHDRIDVVCLAPNFAVTATASRYVKAGGVGPVALGSVNKLYADGYTLQVVAGTPAGSPTPPAVPSGYIEIAQVLITATVGMTGSGAITDERNILTLAASNNNHVIATGSTIQTQLDELDDADIKIKSINPSVTPTY